MPSSYANSGMAIGGKVSGASAGSVLFTSTFNLLSQDNSHFFWDIDNYRLGIGLNTPQCPLDILKNFSSGSFVGQITNSNTGSSAAAGWRAVNDAGKFMEIGQGGSGRTDLLANCAYLLSLNGGTSFFNASADAFRFLVSTPDSSGEVASLSSTGSLTLNAPLVLKGSSSGVVTITSAAAAGTWGLTLPTDGGTSGYVLSTDGMGVTSWIAGGGGGGTIGDLITGATSDSTTALKIVRNAAGAPMDITLQNTANDGNAALIAMNDLGHFCYYGFAGSLEGAIADRAFIFSNHGGLNLISSDGSSSFVFTSGSTDVATINSVGWLGLGTTSPQGPLDLVGNVSGDNLTIRVKNEANNGTSCIDTLGDTGNYCLFGYGGSARGDNLQDRGFIFSQHGGLNVFLAGDNFQVTIGSPENTNSYLFVNSTSVGIGAGNTSPQASAALDVASTTQGFLPPRLSTTQKTSISSPAEGLIVYDTTLHKLSVFTGTVWETVTSI